MLVLLGVFAKGLRYLKVNADLFPREAAGLVLNCVFIVAFGVVLVMLGKFWVSWTFLSTLQYILVMSTSRNI